MGRHWSNVSRYNADSEPSIEKKSVSSSRSTPPGTSRSKRGHQGVAFGDVDKDGAGVDQIEVLLGKPVPNHIRLDHLEVWRVDAVEKAGVDIDRDYSALGADGIAEQRTMEPPPPPTSRHRHPGWSPVFTR
jgi:hypothetical protein